MGVKVEELMVHQVVTAEPHQTAGRVRRMMETNSVHALPIVDGEGRPVGIVSTADFTADVKDGAPVSSIMTEKVYTVPRYDDVHIAARVMRNHRIHHLVVTEEKKIVGILSSLDLLKLIEEHRFVMKGAPTPSRRKGNQRE